MAAFVEIVAGADAGKRIQIETRFISIGGHPGSEVLVSNEPDEVATLRYRNKEYSVFNQTDTALELGNGLVERDEPSIWRRGKDLKLPGGTVLRLIIEGDPNPVKEYTVEVDDDDSPDFDELINPPEDEPEAKSSDNLTVALFVILILMLVWVNIPTQPSIHATRNITAEYHQIVSYFIKDDRALERVRVEEVDEHVQVRFNELRRILQDARISELRGNYSRAISRYQNARDMLLILGVSKEAPGKQLPTRMNKYKLTPLQVYATTYRFVMLQLDLLT